MRGGFAALFCRRGGLLYNALPADTATSAAMTVTFEIFTDYV